MYLYGLFTLQKNMTRKKKAENIDVYAFERCDDNDSGNGFISILSFIYDVQRKLGTQFIHTFSRE